MARVPLPKYLQISQQLEADIKAGRWDKGKLPSVRDIAGEHRVSVVTASRALQILRDKRLINTVDRSGCYLIPPSNSTGERWALCLRVTPGAWTQAVAYLAQAGFEAVARRQSMTLDTTLFTEHQELSERDWQRLVRGAREAGMQGLFLLPSRINEASARQDALLLTACRSQGVPVVLIERNLRGHGRPLEHDLICGDDVAGAALCTRHLLEQGRQRIAFVTGSPTSSHDDRIAGYLHALCRSSPPVGQSEPIILQQPTELPSKEAFQILTDQVLKHRVDGVVCYQDYAAMGLIMELLARGVRVPRDVALTGFDDLAVGNSFSIRVTTFSYPSEGVARQAFRVMRQRIQSPTEEPVKVIVPGKLLIRESSVAGVQ